MNTNTFYAQPVSYHAAHIRVGRIRGRASDYECVNCGRPAAEWSYRHDSQWEQTGWARRSGKLPIWTSWSPDPEAYDPMCRPCHRERDRERADATR